MCPRDPDRRYPSHHRGESRECQPSFARTVSYPNCSSNCPKPPLSFLKGPGHRRRSISVDFLSPQARGEVPHKRMR